MIAKSHQPVVGLLFCHYHPVARRSITRYAAIDTVVAEARRCAFVRVLRRLSGILRGRRCSRNLLFYGLHSA